jgi:hypothetical protein
MSCRIPPTILHTKGENTRSFIVYSVWDNKTDKAVIIDGEARKCAEAMGISFSSFYSIVSRLRKGQGKRWTISSRYLDGGYRRTRWGKKGGE